MPQRSPSRRRPRRPPRAGLHAAAISALALALAGGLILSAGSARAAEDTPAPPVLFEAAAVSLDALGDARGSGLSDPSRALMEVRLGVVLWDEVPPQPRRPPPRNAGAGAATAGQLSFQTRSSHAPGG